MLRLGWDTISVPPSYTALGTTISEAMQAVEALRRGSDSGRNRQPLLRKAQRLPAINGIDQAPPGVDAQSFSARSANDCSKFSLTDYLAAHQPALFNLLSILNVIETEIVPATAHTAHSCPYALPLGQPSGDHS